MQALGVIRPLTVRSTLLAAKTVETLISNRAVLIRAEDLFISIVPVRARLSSDAMAALADVVDECKAVFHVFRVAREGCRLTLIRVGSNLARGRRRGNTTITTMVPSREKAIVCVGIVNWKM
ncbi:hypothetical protein PFUM301598_28880 [Pseudomonas fluorescens]